jgi:hypothetical protein
MRAAICRRAGGGHAVVLQGQGQDLAAQAGLEVGDLPLQLGDAGGGRGGRVGLVGSQQLRLPVAGAVGAEVGGGEKVGHGLQQGGLAEVDDLGVVGGDVGAALVGWLALVVAGGVAVVAPHPQPAAAAPQPAAEQVLGLAVGGAAGCGGAYDRRPTSVVG